HVVVVIDGEGSILEANAAAARILGLRSRRLAGRRLLTLLNGADQDGARAALRAPFRRRLDWKLHLRSLTQPLTCDCLPFTHDGQARLAIIGRSPETVRGELA